MAEGITEARPRALRHAAAVLVFFVLLALWLYLSTWIHTLINQGPGYCRTPADVWAYWSNFSGWDKSYFVVRLLLGCGAVIAYVTFLFELYKDRRSLHGDARFANEREVSKAGLYAKKGILIGKAFGKFLVSGGQEFVLLAAKTRGGKGVGFVIPNLLNWFDSLICMDLKLENWNLTSLYRKLILKQDVFLFCPFSETRRSHRWNPLDEVSRDPYRMVGDVQQIAQIFYPSRESDKNRFFSDQAQNLFTGIALFLLESNHPRCSMGEVLRQGSGYEKPLQTHLRQILQVHPNLSRQCRDSISRALSNPDETFGNIKASFDAPLNMFTNPLVDAATSGSDFSLADIRRKRMSIYFGIVPKHLPSAERLMNIFWTQAISLNTAVLPEDDKSLKYQCFLLMDEMAAFGRLNILIKAVAFIAGYGLRLGTILQSKAQLEGDGLYNRADSKNLIVNHDVKIGFTPGDLDDAKDLAAILGTYTTTSTSVSSNRSSNHLMAINANASAGVNVSEQKRDLLMPQELLRMPLTREIVCKTGLRPIDAEKIFYYKEPVFVDRLKRVSPSLHALGKDLPTQDQLEAARIAGELAAPVPLLPIEELLKALSGERAPKESEAASAMTVEQVNAAAQTLAAQISDWTAFSTVSDIKAHISKAFFMQEFLGNMAGGAHVAI